MFMEHSLCACMLSGQPAVPSETTVAVTLTGEKRELGGHRNTKDVAEFALGQSKTSYVPPLTLEPIHLSTIVCLFPRQIPARRLPIYMQVLAAQWKPRQTGFMVSTLVPRPQFSAIQRRKGFASSCRRLQLYSSGLHVVRQLPGPFTVSFYVPQLEIPIHTQL